MYLDYSVFLNCSISEKHMLNYLMNEFCHDAYERDQMIKWIKQKDIKYVYDTVTRLFAK